MAIGTDGSASNNDLDMFEEMHLTALVQKGIKNDPTVLPAEQVLYMATMGGAIALNMEDQIGSLEAGKDADIVITDGCPFEVSTQVIRVYIDGRAVEVPKQGVE